MKVPQLATYRLPLALGSLGAVSPLLMGAAPDTAVALSSSAGFVLTGNPILDGMILAAIMGPLAGAAAWVIKTVTGVGIAAITAALEAYADAVEAKARKTPGKADDEVSGAVAKGLRAAAARLRKADKSTDGQE